MAKISSYQVGVPDPSDLLIGTDVQTGQTKNYSVNAVASLVKATGASWQFKISDTEGTPEKSSIYFPGFGHTPTAFSGVTELIITPKMTNNTNSLAYLQSLVGQEIYVADQNNLSQFANFQFNTLTADTLSDNYKMDLTFVSGNGGFVFQQYYGIVQDPTGGDKTFIFTQGLPSNTWVITHDLAKFPSVSVVDSGNSTVEGGITYNSDNQLTVTFTASFSGKAYLN